MSYNKECCNLYAIGKVDYDCEIIECEYECVGINAEVCFLCMCSSCSNVTDGLKIYIVLIMLLSMFPLKVTLYH